MSILKTILNAFCMLCVLPVYLVYIAAACVGRERAFAGFSQLFALLPGKTGVYLRRAFFRLTANRCAGSAEISFGTVCTHPGVSFDDNTYVGVYCVLGDVRVGRDTLIASQVSVMNGINQHGIDDLTRPIREQPGVFPKVTIGEDCWIGERAVIAANVGSHCVVGAGAVVMEPLPDYAIAVGVPARIVKYRDGREAASHHSKSTEQAADMHPQLQKSL